MIPELAPIIMACTVLAGVIALSRISRRPGGRQH